MTRLEISCVFHTKQQAMTACDRLSCWYIWPASSSERPPTELGLKKLSVSIGETVLEIGVAQKSVQAEAKNQGNIKMETFRGNND